MRFIDLFAGLGGFHLALKSLGHNCVFASELSSELRNCYKQNFPEMGTKNIIGDIHNYPVKSIPKFDIICAGFPCQPFSQAGKMKGLSDPKNGNHFEKIMSIIQFHKPKYLILENVSTLEKHDNGKTWNIMNSELSVEYDVKKQVLSPHQFGIPQHRKRIFIVGKRKDYGGLNGFNFNFNGLFKATSHIQSILDQNPNPDIEMRNETLMRLNVWQDFLKNLSPSSMPRFPIWATEFGATYPFENTATYNISFRDLKKFKGSFGNKIDGESKNEVLNCLPTYARSNRSKMNLNNKFPTWKINYIKKNREFYFMHKRWIDPWLEQIKNWDHSHQKLEWNCGLVESTLKDKIIQFRPSGIRVKNSDKAPAIVLSNTQIPIIYDNTSKTFRYMTNLEVARLQSMEKLKHFPKPSKVAYRAFGNAVNVKVVSNIIKKLVHEG